MTLLWKNASPPTNSNTQRRLSSKGAHEPDDEGQRLTGPRCSYGCCDRGGSDKREKEAQDEDRPRATVRAERQGYQGRAA